MAVTATPRHLLALAGAVVRSPFTKVGPDARAPEARIVGGPLRIDPGHLAAYARVCGFGPDRLAPLPLTYPHVLGFPAAMRLMSRRDFPLPLLGLVHTWITISRHTPLTSEDRPEITVYAEGLAPHRRGTEATMVTEARLAGRLVWESRSGYLARHGRPPGPPEEPRAPFVPLPLPEVAAWHLPADLGRRYAAVSGDRNPIHLHPLAARAFGFPGTVAHGMWTLARCLAEADPDGELTAVRAEFKAPILLPRTVAYASDGRGAFQLRSGERLHLTGVTSATSARAS
ncbi:MaoC family dehydratase [Streptomyces sp. NPDC015346]|uniref:MaoC family dehydratase n=1 Tax=Streptomyces sp. NPDC015346 TaxID=3364954 RepID=UPI0036F88664